MSNEKTSMYLAIAAIIIAVIGIGLSFNNQVGPMGPAGSDGAVGPTGPTGVSYTPTAEPESCVVCHEEAGAEHQASYDVLYQDGVITVTDMAYEYTAPSTHIVTFTLLKDGVPYDPADASRIRMYFVPWTGTAFQFEPAGDRMALTGIMTHDGLGGVTSTLTVTAEGVVDEPKYASSFDDRDGAIMLYGYDDSMGTMPNSRVTQAKYPIGGLLETGDGIDVVSAANNDGCENCHSVPFLKHGYYYGQFNDDPTTDFISCKACHMENAEGGHLEWQLLVDDPVKAVEWLGTDEDLSIFTPEQLELYAYEMSLMNDVHMSHAMEFPYPQSMANCIVCHEDKLDVILTDDNFNVPTCKSCHPMTGSEEYGTNETAIVNLLPSPIHDTMDIDTVDCASCHSEGGIASVFSDIHTGYDKLIYAAPDLRYSDAVIVTIDDVSVANDLVTVKFSAAEATDLAGIDVEDIAPTVLVGMYGWDTKDYIIGPHERLVDDNGDGEISRSSGDNRALEYDVGAEHPRGTTVSAAGGAWEVVIDMSTWGDLIADGTVKRLEIAVIPELENADGVVVALDAPSRTFDLATDDFDDDYYDPIVDVDKCQNCHDALATNYHSPDRGGNIVVCRLCHITKSGGSHLEVQSRSIDSYVHAIHSMQAFDIGDIDFTDVVEELHYEHHTGMPYPTHGIQNCESCHIEGMYEVPDQSKSLPGLLSATDSVEDRNIGDLPQYITGPAARACGGCHRAKLITADDANGLAAFNQHTNMGGYLFEGEDNKELDTLLEVIDDIMANFE
jgi:OmcA/MtrC family decaheme c-type cytochrome